MLRQLTLIILVLCLCISCAQNPPIEKIFDITQNELAELKLSYYSDYFSFVGEDDQGLVSFAIDNNRGQDGDTFQADHFLVLHDEKSGWQDVKGNGLYANDQQQLSTIPNSTFFTFEGSPQQGLVINSNVNDLSLTISPIQSKINRGKGLSQYQMGSAKAVLNWKGREIKGRVIHEYLYLPAFNRLSRKYFGFFKAFNGFYARLGEQGDFYLHLQKSEKLAPLIGHALGFVVINDTFYELKNIDLKTESTNFAWGFYSWPNHWRGNIDTASQKNTIELKLVQQNSMANWVLGGFAMGIIKGQLEIDNNSIEIYGLGELIM